MNFEEYEDDAGYTGAGAMSGLFDDALDAITLGPARRALAGDDPLPPQQVDVLDPNSVAQAGAASDQQIAQSMTPAGGFPAFAGTPQVFMGRITKLNAVMGTAIAVNTSPLDPGLMSVVRSYQASRGLTADGKMGPVTEARLDADLGGQKPVVPPSTPGIAPAPPSGGLQNASTSDADDKKKLMIALGVGAVALLGLAYVATR